jgi:hypothetical protein
MTTQRLIGAAVVLAVTQLMTVGYTQDKPFVRVTEEQARAALTAAAAGAKGNPVSLENNFQREIRKIWNDYDNNVVNIYERAELNVSVMGPAELYVRIASAELRRGGSIDNIAWPGGVSVYVSPLTPESPNVVDTIVTRAGVTIEPTHKALVPRQTVVTRGQGTGPARTVHEGAVLYPVDAFSPGAEVEVHAVTDSGRRLSRKVFDRDLRKIQ